MHTASACEGAAPVCARPERKLCTEAGRGCWPERAPPRWAVPEPCRSGRASRPLAAVAKPAGTVRSPRRHQPLKAAISAVADLRATLSVAGRDGS